MASKESKSDFNSRLNVLEARLVNFEGRFGSCKILLTNLRARVEKVENWCKQMMEGRRFVGDSDVQENASLDGTARPAQEFGDTVDKKDGSIDGMAESHRGVVAETDTNEFEKKLQEASNMVELEGGLYEVAGGGGEPAGSSTEEEENIEDDYELLSIEMERCSAEAVLDTSEKFELCLSDEVRNQGGVLGSKTQEGEKEESDSELKMSAVNPSLIEVSLDISEDSEMQLCEETEKNDVIQNEKGKTVYEMMKWNYEVLAMYRRKNQAADLLSTDKEVDELADEGMEQEMALGFQCQRELKAGFKNIFEAPPMVKHFEVGKVRNAEALNKCLMEVLEDIKKSPFSRLKAMEEILTKKKREHVSTV
jgi:hypothetical protein